MIKKIIFTTSVLMNVAYAGTMGPVHTEPTLIPYVSGEANASWFQIQSASLFGAAPEQNFQHWGGRAAAGLLYPFKDKWAADLELGWGYYGSAKISNTASTPNGVVQASITNNSDLYGFDVLAGAMYRYELLDVFLKAGAMVENRHYSGAVHTTINSSSLPGPRSSGIHVRNTQTNVFPEIKVGGIYNINPALGLSVAYMHVFGNNSLYASMQGNFPDSSSAPEGITTSAALDNPSIDSVMFGLVYRFA